MSRHDQTRRRFLLTALGTVGSVAGVSAYRQHLRSQAASPVNPMSSTVPPTPAAIANAPVPSPAPLPERPFGSTNLSLPILGLGGSASPLSRSHQEAEALALIQRSLDLGIRYFDTAANYGPSEEFLGKVLPPHRSQVVLATKTSQRDYDGAWRNLERSLQRLQTDYIDLWQFHALTYDWDVDTLLHPQTGAIKAAQTAQEQGLVRHIGVTGHNNPDIIITALQRYPFDAALVPINAADKHTPRPFITHLLPLAQQQNTAIIAMKVPAYGRLLKPGVLSGMGEAIGYTLSQPGVHTCIIAADTLPQLEANVAAARQFQPLSAEAMMAIEQRTAAVWEENSFFRRWT